MSLILRFFSCLLIVAVALPLPSHAQERSATGVQDRQISWKALSDMAAATDSKLSQVNARIGESVECGKRGKVYAGKGTAGADANGCINPNYDMTIINKFIACGNNNQVYSQATDTCRSTSKSSVSANCSLQTISTNNGTCPAGYSNFGTVFAGYARPAFHDGCETCNPIYTTTCGRSVCQ